MHFDLLHDVILEQKNRISTNAGTQPFTYVYARYHITIQFHYIKSMFNDGLCQKSKVSMSITDNLPVHM